MATFPSYGELLLDSFNAANETSLIRSDMESGPAKQAKVRSKELVKLNVTYRFTSAEFDTWKTWRDTDIARGASYFDWVELVNGDTVQARMVNGVYQAKPFSNSGELKWDVSFTLEVYE